MGRLPVTAVPSQAEGANGSQVDALVVDPRNPQKVYAAGPAGVFYSTDAGLSWQARNEGIHGAGIVALTLNPQQPDTLFASTADNVLYRSDDGGKTWQTIPGSS